MIITRHSIEESLQLYTWNTQLPFVAKFCQVLPRSLCDKSYQHSFVTSEDREKLYAEYTDTDAGLT